MNKKRRKILLITLAITILFFVGLLIFIGYFKKHINSMPPKIMLLGEKIVILDYGNKYNEEGFKASFRGKDVSDKITVSDNIDLEKLGTYFVDYSYTYRFIALSKTISRTVVVTDTKSPELTVESEDKISIPVGSDFKIPTASAIDNYDGDISDKIVIDSTVNPQVSGTYTVTYSVEDTSDNLSTKTITVVVSGKNARIDIYISQQKLYYYEYGNIVLSSDIVTGIHNGTPTGHYKILNKARNTTLKGEDYESFVNYWIAFRGSSYGIHDASWRSQFGGQIYKTNGSHGCVNMPYYNVQKLYNMAPIGTPVNIYP